MDSETSNASCQKPFRDDLSCIAKFLPRATRYRQLRLIQAPAIIAFGVTITGSILTILFKLGLPWQELMVVVACGSMAALAGTLIWQEHLVRCVACQKNLKNAIGTYCPECGHKSLTPSKQGYTSKSSVCSSCGKEIRWRKLGGKFRLHHCIHCGTLLDERGLDI